MNRKKCAKKIECEATTATLAIASSPNTMQDGARRKQVFPRTNQGSFCNECPREGAQRDAATRRTKPGHSLPRHRTRPRARCCFSREHSSPGARRRCPGLGAQLARRQRRSRARRPRRSRAQHDRILSARPRLGACGTNRNFRRSSERVARLPDHALKHSTSYAHRDARRDPARPTDPTR